MNDLRTLRDGDIVIVLWSDDRCSIVTWGNIKECDGIYPIGWFENTDENYWKYVGSKEFE